MIANGSASIVRLSIELRPQLLALLARNCLPTDDCESTSAEFFGVINNAQLVAAGGLQGQGDHALIRSLVVDQAYRSRGLARTLVEFLLCKASDAGKASVYLLTETAESYFQAMGFALADRAEAPVEIASTEQFSTLCPATASFMKIDLSQR